VPHMELWCNIIQCRFLLVEQTGFSFMFFFKKILSLVMGE